jgi:phosphatidyl-myo-inositol alpha-mannosyltransferase
MRIALICPYHMWRGGGVKEHVVALYDQYVKAGHYVRIITPLPSDYEGPVELPIITLGVSRTTTAFAGSAWQWSFSVDTEAIDEVFEREKFDILHFHEPWLPVWSRQLVARSKSANIATMHGRWMDTMTAKTMNTVVIPYTKPMIKHFDAFTAVSDAAAEYFKTLSTRPVTIVPNGINIERFAKAPASAVRNHKQKTILYVGRLENRKGVKYLLRAFHDLTDKHDDVQLLIAGTGVDDKKLREYVKENEVPRVTFLGYISDEDKLHYLHRADLFCSPAFYGESFGIVLLEAMAAGLPIVAGDNVGYQAVMTGRGALSLVNPQDTVDFTRRLEVMLYDEELRQLWCQWAKAHISQFEFPKIAQQYLGVYEKAMARHGKKRQT